MKTHNQSLKVVVAGHICLDIIPHFQNRLSFHKDFKPGKLLQTGEATLSPGGAVSNTGLALHKLGIDVDLVGKTGQDPFGELLRNLFGKYDKKLLRYTTADQNSPTSYSIVLNLPDYDRLFLHCSGSNDSFLAVNVPEASLEDASLLHFGYPPAMKSIFRNRGRELRSILQRARKKEVFTSLDMSMPDPNSESGDVDWIALLEEILPHVGLFIPSLDEVLFMLRRNLYEKIIAESSSHGNTQTISTSLIREIAGELLEMGCSMAAIKMGELGIYLRTSSKPDPYGLLASLQHAAKPGLCTDPEQAQEQTVWVNRELWVPSQRVKVLGTTGAGDSSIAGFLAALLRGYPPEDVLRMASAAGACCVEQTDATSGIISWEHVRDKGYNRPEFLPAPPEMHDWICDHPIWKGPDDRYR